MSKVIALLPFHRWEKLRFRLGQALENDDGKNVSSHLFTYYALGPYLNIVSQAHP